MKKLFLAIFIVTLLLIPQGFCAANDNSAAVCRHGRADIDRQPEQAELHPLER